MTTASHHLTLIDDKGEFVLGESEAGGFEGHIDVTDWSWDVKDPTTQKSGKDAATKGAATKGTAGASSGGDTQTKIQPSLFSFEKYVDRSTPRLMSALHKGTKFKKACFTLREQLVGVKLGPHDPFMMVVTLEGDVVLTKCTVSLKAAELGVDLEESWELRYSTIRFELGKGGTRNYREATFDLPPGSEAEASKKAPLTEKEKVERMDPKTKAAYLASLGIKAT